MNEAHRLRGIATEIDMVTNPSLIEEGASSKESGAAHPWFRYYSDVRMTSAAAGMPTKVILQTVPLRNGKIPPDATTPSSSPSIPRCAPPRNLAAFALVDAGSDGYLKTSTGVDGDKATPRDVKIMREVIDTVQGIVKGTLNASEAAAMIRCWRRCSPSSPRHGRLEAGEHGDARDQSGGRRALSGGRYRAQEDRRRDTIFGTSGGIGLVKPAAASPLRRQNRRLLIHASAARPRRYRHERRPPRQCASWPG